MTFVMIVPDDLDFRICQAATTTRLGICHGFEQLGIPWRMMRCADVTLRLPEVDDPIVCYQHSDADFLSDGAVGEIRKHPCVVRAAPWFDGMNEFITGLGLPGPEESRRAIRNIVRSEPAFVWAACTEDYLHFWEGWSRMGLKVVSLPWACDTIRYYPEPERAEFAGTKMALVASYRPYKEWQYERYIWQYADILDIYSHSSWPACYAGYLPDELERVLYYNAVLCPTTSDVMDERTGNTVERPFKIAGSGGLTIIDTTPCYHQLFDDDEMLMPRSDEEYHYLVQRALNEPDFNAKWREREYQAVMKKHTYTHRAQEMLRLLGRKES